MYLPQTDAELEGMAVSIEVVLPKRKLKQIVK
jgi:hypothetical protein